MRTYIDKGFTLTRRYSTLQIVAILVIIFLVMPFSTFVSANPILSHRPTADPHPFIHDGRLYVMTSNDAWNLREGYDIRGYVLVSTTDMKNWLDHGEVFQVPRDAHWAGRAFAPAAVSKDGRIYLYFPDGGSSIGVAVANNPEGPFVDALRRPLISRSTPGANVPWLFDPMVFVDDDGSAYIYFGGGPPDAIPTAGENLRVMRLGANMTSVVGTASVIAAPRSFEASFLHKRNGIYYFTYSTNFEGSSARIDYLTSDNPLTGFVHRGTVLENPAIGWNNINMWNNNHHGIIEFEGIWYIFYHDRRVFNNVYRRNISVELLHHNADGTIRRISEVTENGPPQIRNFNPFQTVRASTINRQNGIAVEASTESKTMVTSINNSDWIRLLGVDFGSGATRFEARVASGSNGGSIEIRRGSRTGPIVGTLQVPSTGGWNAWQTLTTDITGLSGVHNLYFVFRGTGTDNLFNWAWWQFHPADSVSTSVADVVREFESYEYAVWAAPNPFVGEVVIKNRAPLSTENLTIEIYNISGEKIYKTTTKGNAETRIEESANWKSGIYFIVLSNSTGVVSVGRIIKTNN